MSAEPLIRELFRALEATIHERLSLVENILNTIEKPKVPLYDHEFIRRIERLEQAVNFLQMAPPSAAPVPFESGFEKEMLEERIAALEEQLAATCAQVEALEVKNVSVIKPESSVVLVREEDVAEPLEEVAVEEVVEDEEENAPSSENEEVAEEEAEETAEEEAEEEGAELELDEFPYKGRMFYKDAEDNIYRADDEGEVIPEPIGKWNGKKIVWC
jgi:hypothetical protein